MSILPQKNYAIFLQNFARRGGSKNKNRRAQCNNSRTSDLKMTDIFWRQKKCIADNSAICAGQF